MADVVHNPLEDLLAKLAAAVDEKAVAGIVIATVGFNHKPTVLYAALPGYEGSLGGAVHEAATEYTVMCVGVRQAEVTPRVVGVGKLSS
jgi:hypothetical protein